MNDRPPPDRIARDWIAYRDACYPDGCSALQAKETRQAFFAGATAFFLQTMRATELPKEQAAASIQALEMEIFTQLEKMLAP